MSHIELLLHQITWKVLVCNLLKVFLYYHKMLYENTNLLTLNRLVDTELSVTREEGKQVLRIELLSQLKSWYLHNIDIGISKHILLKTVSLTLVGNKI